MVVFTTACDEVDDPFPEGRGLSFTLDGETEYVVDPSLNITDTAALRDFIESTEWDTIEAPDNANERFILLEEFTGHKCIFCPDGTREIMRLDSIYGDQLIPVGIHAGDFATPEPPPGIRYNTDFRVPPHGEEYLRQFQVAGYPTGMVNRLNGRVSGKDNWGNQINAVRNEAPLAELALTNYVNASLDVVRVQIDISWKQSLSEAYNLQLYLVEDHIIDWQKDGNKVIENYDHRHVLRKVVNGSYGTPLGEASKNDPISYQFITTFKEGWKVQDLESVAFIFNSDEQSFEVIQANAAYLE